MVNAVEVVVVDLLVDKELITVVWVQAADSVTVDAGAVTVDVTYIILLFDGEVRIEVTIFVFTEETVTVEITVDACADAVEVTYLVLYADGAVTVEVTIFV